MSKSVSVWLIIPQTNLHVGNESVGNYGIIDKSIQRDAVTQLPSINSSSLKGAVKEFLTYLKDKDVDIKSLFGSEKIDGKTNGKDSQKGSAVFFDAQLLYIPKQATDGSAPYKLAYSETVVNTFVSLAKSLGVNMSSADIYNPVNNHIDPKAPKEKLQEFNDFQKLCDDEHLPIIARNHLANGESVNLWYEQVLPSHAILGTIILTNGENDLDILNGKIVQIGANATIGYGYCKFYKLSVKN